MALTKTSISNIELEIFSIKTCLQELSTGIENINSSLINDSNYQVFIMGTDIGKELNNKLQKVIELQRSLNDNSIKDIIDKCSNLIEVQKQLNNGSGE